MQVRWVSKVIEVVKILWGFITAHRLEFQLLVLIGLGVILWYIVRRRRSKTLSVLVAREFGEYKRKLRRRLLLSERLSSWRYVIAGFFLPVTISMLFGLLGLVAGTGKNDAQDVERFLRTLHVCGTIVASFSAILMTIIVFSLQVSGAYMVKTRQLFRFYLQRMYFKPVLAFAGGTAAACLVNSVLIDYLDWWPLGIVAVMVVLGCGVIGLDLVLFFTGVTLLGPSSMVELLGENYVGAHRNSLLAHVKRMLAQTTHTTFLERLGFSWNPFGLYEQSESVKYTVRSQGRFVNDVQFRHLEKLAKKWKLQPIERDEKQAWTWEGSDPPNIKIWPGEKLPEKEERLAAMVVKGKEWESRAQRMFEEAYFCDRKNRWRVPRVEWLEISHLLKTLIEDKDIAGVKSVLEAFRSIAADYLESRREINWPHGIRTLDEEIMSPYSAPTLLNLDFYNFIRFAIRNEDEECVDEVGGFLYMMANTAFEFESEQYFDEVLLRLNWLYELSRGSESLAERTAATVIRHYKNVGKIFDYHVYKDEKNQDLYNHVFPFVERYLKNVLKAMREAAKYDDKETFHKLLETANSLLKNYIQDDVRDRYLYNYGQEDPALLEAKLKIRDVKILSNLVVSAWLYRGVKEVEYEKEAVKPLINKALGKILDFGTLIEAYLLAKKVSRHESALGYDWWDVVAGVAYSGDALSRWIEPFWIVDALRRAVSKPRIDVKQIRLFRGVREFDLQRLKSRIDGVLGSTDHKWFTGEEDIRKGKEYLLGVFGALAQRQRKADYEKIIQDSIDERALAAFKDRVLEGYKNESKLRSLITEYQGPVSENNATRINVLGEFLGYVDKEDLIGEGRDTGLADIYGREEGRRETLYYAGIMEEKLVEKGTVGNFGELAARIKNEAARLQQKGFSPQVVLIPWDHRYERELTGVPKWKRKCPIERSPLPKWVTSMDGMEVFVWPHKDSKCVGVIDLGAFVRFKDKEDGQEGRLNIYFRNLEGDELNRFLVREAKERKWREFKRWLRALEYDMGKVSEMKRVVVIEDRVRLEMLDNNAGVKLLPSEETMGIVYREGEAVYHLPECKIAQEIPAGERCYFHNLGLAQLKKGFQSCDNCHPDYDRK